MTFIDNWLPNIVCGLAGCILSWLIGFRQGKRAEARGNKHTLMLENLLYAAERAGNIELDRDSDGRITGGRVIKAGLVGLKIESKAGIITSEGGTPAN